MSIGKCVIYIKYAYSYLLIVIIIAYVYSLISPHYSFFSIV